MILLKTRSFGDEPLPRISIFPSSRSNLRIGNKKCSTVFYLKHLDYFASWFQMFPDCGSCLPIYFSLIFHTWPEIEIALIELLKSWFYIDKSFIIFIIFRSFNWIELRFNVRSWLTQRNIEWKMWKRKKLFEPRARQLFYSLNQEIGRIVVSRHVYCIGVICMKIYMYDDWSSMLSEVFFLVVLIFIQDPKKRIYFLRNGNVRLIQSVMLYKITEDTSRWRWIIVKIDKIEFGNWMNERFLLELRLFENLLEIV